ncbi:hypothetical protein Q5752_004165 [Cryptotrichosporon argae]
MPSPPVAEPSTPLLDPPGPRTPPTLGTPISSPPASAPPRPRPPTLRTSTLRVRPSAAAAFCSPTSAYDVADTIDRGPRFEATDTSTDTGTNTGTAPRSAFAPGTVRGRSRHVSIVQPLVDSRTPATASTFGRSRANTVSVSIRPRAGSVGVASPPLTAARKRSADVEAGRPATAGAAAARGDEARGEGEGEGKSPRLTGDSAGRRRSDSVARAVGADDAFDDDGSGRLHDNVVGLLDVVDPTVGTVNHLQNMTNSVIFPHIPQLWSRRPEVVLSETPTASEDGEQIDGLPVPATAKTARSRGSTFSRLLSPRERTYTVAAAPTPAEPLVSVRAGSPVSPPSVAGSSAALHELARAEFGAELDADVDALEKEHVLDAHVKHVLSRKSATDTLRRVGRGVWAFVKTPMGAFTAVYGFLVAFWGAAIVLFLLGWIPTSSKYRQDVWVEISSQVENGLFTLTGVGLIPWRLVDTYRMSIIHTLKMKTIRLRKQRGLPPIDDPNDLPDPILLADYVSVLSEKEQETLRYQQEKFAKSQTWYRPHATATHRAFPVTWALWNTILMDGNSFFQCLLCGCMWGMNWHVRPAWTTGCLIPLSFLCGIGAAVLIWQGSARTKKTGHVEDKLREALGVPADGAGPDTDASEKSDVGGTGTPAPRSKTMAIDEPAEVVAGDVERPHEGKRRSTVGAPPIRADIDKDEGSSVSGAGSDGKDGARGDVRPA